MAAMMATSDEAALFPGTFRSGLSKSQEDRERLAALRLAGARFFDGGVLTLVARFALALGLLDDRACLTWIRSTLRLSASSCALVTACSKVRGATRTCSCWTIPVSSSRQI